MVSSDAVNQAQTVSGKPLPGHAGAAPRDDGGEGVDRREDAGDRKDADGRQPQIHAEPLARPGGGDCRERRIRGPAGDGGAAGNEARTQ